MKPYSQFRPTQFDQKGLGCDDQQDWLVAVTSRTRDSDVLTESNWTVACKEFDEADPEGVDHDVHRFGHWGPGWFEIILVRPGSKCQEIAEGHESALADYPVLSDDDFCQAECEAANEAWASMLTSERLEYLSELKYKHIPGDTTPRHPHGCETMSDLMACVRGKFFPPGCDASEFLA